jgi:formylglycine-generating enzyme required for sulfatase activity
MSRVVFMFGVAALLGVPTVPARAVTIDMVTVGNAGNANDTGGTFNGAVNYEYQIGKYCVTIGQYTAFLNAADPNGENPNGIYNANMETDPNIAGISYTSGASAGAKYGVMAVSGSSPFGGVTAANRPITYVSWFDAARFANWMTNGQGNGSTETGAYNLATAAAGVAPAKTPGAAFYIPTENEFYKAAFYDPTLNGGTGGYYAYATKSNDAPDNQIGSTANQANYETGAGLSVTQAPDDYSSQNFLTDVGAFSGSGSFYGTFDQSGNVDQWNDLDGTLGSSRGWRGGNWDNNNEFSLSSSFSYLETNPSYENYFIGFRLAGSVGVPEIDPNSLGSALALVLGSLGLLERRRLKAA